MEKFNLTQTGQEVQEILDGAAKLSDVNTEKERAELAEEALGASIQQNAEDIDAIEAKIPSDATAENPLTDKEYVDGLVSDEATAREQADETLQGNIDAEETRAKAAEKQNADDIDAIEEKIPNQASSLNQLADKEYVEDLVSTASATFRGTFNLVSDLHLTIDASRSDIAAALGNAIATADNNDYAFVLIPTSVDTPNEIASIERYKYNGSAWGFEYALNNSGYTAAQWAAINSGITSALVTKLGALPTASELETALLAKQDVLTFDSAPTPGSLNPVTSAGIHTAIDTEKGARQNADAALQQAIEAILVLIPSAASALNQLADKAFVNSSIATNTATFRGTFNLVSDLHLALNASHTDVANALANAISSANNNDYCFVQIPTSVDTPTEIRVTERYKFNGTAWAYEYDLNNSGFTVAQWEAINSAITSALVTKLSALPTAAELATELAGKQAVLTFDNQPTSGSSNPVKSGGVYDVVAAINAKIPSDADAANKMTTEARIATIIGALDATFDLTSADGHITFKMTQTDGLIASVQILTYDIASAAALTTLGGRVSLNESDISNLQAAYAALTQSDIVIVNGSLPSSGQQQNIIYRQPDPDHNPPQFYSDYMWNGTTWVLMATYNNAIDPRPKKGSQNLVTSGGVFDNMGALDVSELNATENPHTLATYADLSAALAAIPSDYQKGGMSIKFVSNSDNMYLQYRLMADEWSADTDDWAIADEGVYVENPEFVYVKTDAEGKILWAIKFDGSIYYGAGVPQQVKDYIEEKIAELSLDEYEDIVAFLSDYLGSDTTLKVMIDSINERIPEIIENPEFLEVTTDSEDKVLEGIQQDGTKYIGGDLNVEESASINKDAKILGNMEISGVLYKVIENSEYLVAWVDAKNKVVFGLKTNGRTFVGDIDFINAIKENKKDIKIIKNVVENIINTINSVDVDALTVFSLIDNIEFISVETDNEGKILSARKINGNKVENAPVELPSAIISGLKDREGRLEIITDFEGKIVAYYKKDGIRVENVGIELSPNGYSTLGEALKEYAHIEHHDWSNEKFIEIPIPRCCAIINFGVDVQANSKSSDIRTYIQYWDKDGNYFKKNIVLNAQGSSSMQYQIKNQGFDLDDGSEIKFGDWCPMDSFHIKKYFIDVFRGQCIVCYHLTEQVYQTRPYSQRRPWSYLNAINSVSSALGSFSKDFDTGALAHPDGFPVKVFFNGKNAGVYTFNLKKARGNYYCKKDNQKHILLDGMLGDVFWMADGNLNAQGVEGTEIWNDFEIRNPKISKDINGNKYDGDNPTEPSDDYLVCKNNIKRLTTAITEVNAQSTTEDKRTKFEEFFNLPFLIDYDLISQVVFNYDGYAKNWIWLTNDGKLWCPTSYDMDSVFGQHWNGASYVGGITTILGDSVSLPSGLLKVLFKTEMDNRYKELRDKGIFTVENIVGLFDSWIKRCGYDNLKEDIEKIAVSPYYDENNQIVRDSKGNAVLIPNTPSYRDGSKKYLYNPQEGGWYNSLSRIENWLIQRIAFLDSYFNYNI